MSDFWDVMSKKSSPAISAIAGTAIGAASMFAVGTLGYFNKNRDLDIRMLEISLGILREDPNESNITAAREWAVDLLDLYSGKPLSDEARRELIDRPLVIDGPVSSSLERLRDLLGAQKAGIYKEPITPAFKPAPR